MAETDERGLGVSLAGRGGLCFEVAEGGATEAHLLPLDAATHTGTRFLTDVLEGTLKPGTCRHRPCKGMMAGKGQSGSALHQIRIDLMEIGDRDVGQGQGSGLVKDNGVYLAQALDAVSRVQQDAAPEQST